MNLHRHLLARAAEGRPVRVGLVGCGKFGAMFLAQVPRMTGIHVLGIADLAPGRVKQRLLDVGWEPERSAAADAEAAVATGATWLTDDVEALLSAPGLEIVVEATGDPRAGVRHARRAIAAGRHLVMVNVEADVLCGPALAREAERAGVLYSLAWGDQPALVCEHVDWALACGFEVVCAGKGTRYLPSFHQADPDTVWSHFGIAPEDAARGGMNPKMFASFVDGTKSAVEMAAVANATGLRPPAGGLGFPPAACRELATVCRPRAAGGSLDQGGTVEVVSSLRRDGTPIADDLTLGTYVVVRGGEDYVRRCFGEYGFSTDPEREHFALWRPAHLIGLELGISIASLAGRGEPTGVPRAFVADVVAVAKRDLRAGEVLDGEGGYRVWGRLRPAADALATGSLPIGLAHDLALRRDVAAGAELRWSDVEAPAADEVLVLRRAMESGRGSAAAAG